MYLFNGEHASIVLVAVFYGLLTIAVAFLAEVLGSSLMQLAFSLLGIVGGPMLSVFFMGLFIPWMNNLVIPNIDLTEKQIF